MDGTVALVKKVIPPMRKAYGWRNRGKMLNVVYERPSNLRGLIMYLYMWLRTSDGRLAYPGNKVLWFYYGFTIVLL